MIRSSPGPATCPRKQVTKRSDWEASEYKTVPLHPFLLILVLAMRYRGIPAARSLQESATRPRRLGAQRSGVAEPCAITAQSAIRAVVNLLTMAQGYRRSGLPQTPQAGQAALARRFARGCAASYAGTYTGFSFGACKPSRSRVHWYCAAAWPGAPPPAGIRRGQPRPATTGKGGRDL